MDEYPADSKCYQIGEEIGLGMRSVVHKARCISNNSNSVVAIKIIEFQKSVEDMERVAKKAMNMAASVTHPNILKPHCIFIVADSLWVVMPFVSRASLVWASGMTDEHIAALLKGICNALCHLHRQGLMHGDVKPGNILVDSDGSVKLGDLGFSASVCGSNDLTELETPLYLSPLYLYWVPPEMVYSCGSIRSDIWSFGITALELAHGRPPLSHLPPCDSLIKRVNRRFGFVDRFHTSNVGGLSRNTKFSDQPTWSTPRSGSRCFKNMVASCLNNNELSRPSAQELMEHQFFKNRPRPEYLINRIVKNSQRPRLGAYNIVGWKLDEERFELDLEHAKMKRMLEMTSENRKSELKMKKLEETKSTEERIE